MGKLSLLLVLAAVLTGGSLVYNTQRTALDTDDRTSAYQFQFFAREAALAGLDQVMRGVISNVTATIPPGPWTFAPVTDVPYQGGFYSVTGTAGGLGVCSGISPAYADTLDPGAPYLEVRSTGRYDTEVGEVYNGEADIYHQVVACYVRLDVSDVRPPAFEYAFISNEEFRFNGGVEINAIDGEGNIHSNSTMYLGPQVDIAGHVTYTVEAGSTIHRNAEVSSAGPGPGVPMETFEPEDYRLDAHLSSGSVAISNFTTVAPTGWPNTTVGTAENPFLWFIDGDLTLSGTGHLHLPAYTIIVVNGNMSISGSASITVSGSLPPSNPTEQQMLDWIAQNSTEDGYVKTGFYVSGVETAEGSGEYDGGVTIGGTGTVVGNIYTNADFTLNGGGSGANLIGSVAAVGTVTGNGGGQGHNFWYMAAAQEVVIPGVLIPRELISMIAISEWSDPVLKNTGGP